MNRRLDSALVLMAGGMGLLIGCSQHHAPAVAAAPFFAPRNDTPRPGQGLALTDSDVKVDRPCQAPTGGDSYLAGVDLASGCVTLVLASVGPVTVVYSDVSGAWMFATPISAQVGLDVDSPFVFDGEALTFQSPGGALAFQARPDGSLHPVPNDGSSVEQVTGPDGTETIEWSSLGVKKIYQRFGAPWLLTAVQALGGASGTQVMTQWTLARDAANGGRLQALTAPDGGHYTFGYHGPGDGNLAGHLQVINWPLGATTSFIYGSDGSLRALMKSAPITPPSVTTLAYGSASTQSGALLAALLAPGQPVLSIFRQPSGMVQESISTSLDGTTITNDDKFAYCADPRDGSQVTRVSGSLRQLHEWRYMIGSAGSPNALTEMLDFLTNTDTAMSWDVPSATLTAEINTATGAGYNFAHDTTTRMLTSVISLPSQQTVFQASTFSAPFDQALTTYDELGVRSDMTYDSAGRIKSVSRSSDVVTYTRQSTSDGGYQTCKQLNSQATQCFSFDSQGRFTSALNNVSRAKMSQVVNGTTSTITLPDLDVLTVNSGPTNSTPSVSFVGPPAGSGATQLTLSQDSVLDGFGRTVAISGINGPQTWQYNYDDAGRVIAMSVPGSTLGFTYGISGDLQSMTKNGGAVPVELQNENMGQAKDVACLSNLTTETKPTLIDTLTAGQPCLNDESLDPTMLVCVASGDSSGQSGDNSTGTGSSPPPPQFGGVSAFVASSIAVAITSSNVPPAMVQLHSVQFPDSSSPAITTQSTCRWQDRCVDCQDSNDAMVCLTSALFAMTDEYAPATLQQEIFGLGGRAHGMLDRLASAFPDDGLIVERAQVGDCVASILGVQAQATAAWFTTSGSDFSYLSQLPAADQSALSVAGFSVPASMPQPQLVEPDSPTSLVDILAFFGTFPAQTGVPGSNWQTLPQVGFQGCQTELANLNGVLAIQRAAAFARATFVN